MPPYPSTSGRVPAVGVLLAVIAGLLLGGIVGLAVYDDEDDGGGTASATTSTSLAGSQDATTSTSGAGGSATSSTSATTAPGGGTSTSTTVAGGGTTTPTAPAGTSPTTVPGMVQGEEETLAHTGAATGGVLLAGLGLGGLALATRRASRRLTP